MCVHVLHTLICACELEAYLVEKKNTLIGSEIFPPVPVAIYRTAVMARHVDTHRRSLALSQVCASDWVRRQAV